MLSTAVAQAADAAVGCKAAQAADEAVGHLAAPQVCTVDPPAVLPAVGDKVSPAAGQVASTADTADAARGQQGAGATVALESQCS